MVSVLGRKVTLFVAVLLGVCWLLSSIWMLRVERRLIINQMLSQAETAYRDVVVTRHWIASHKGIYVKKDGKYRLLSPCRFNEELYVYSKGRVPCRVRVAMLMPLSPAHKADDFEKKAILSMQESGGKPVWGINEASTGAVFRFAAPLRFTEECMGCHRYSQTNVSGCVSITFSADFMLNKLHKDRGQVFLVMFVFMVAVFAVLSVMLRVWVILPLGQFVDASKKVSEGDLQVRMDEDRGDEWGVLAKNFNSIVKRMLSHRREMEIEVKKAIERVEAAYQELKETESFKSEFFSNITHDLKTPLTAMKGAVDLLSRRTGVDPYIEVIRKNMDKLSKMIGDLLDCARLESGKLEMNMEVQDLVEVVEDTVFMTGLMAKQKDVTIEVEKEGDEVVLPFDGDRISQVVANLLSNAIRFSPEGGKVLVKVDVEGSWAVVSVEDFGPGIPPGERERVFEKFYRIKKNGESSGSTGLGLAICKGIVEAHGGRIEISEPDGHRGTRVTFLLPGVQG